MASQSTGGPPPTVDVPVYFFPSLKLSVESLLLGSALFGAYTLMMAIALYILIRAGLKQRRNKFMIPVIVWMYLLTTARWASNVAGFMNLVNDPINGKLLTPGNAVAQLLCLSLSAITSDLVILWRAHAICGPNRILLAVSGCFVLLTICDFILSVVDVGKNFGKHTFIENVGVTKYGTVFVVSVLATNLWATTIVGVKTWRYRKHIYGVLRQGSSAQSSIKVLYLIIESGVFYCLFWIVGTAGNATGLNNPRMMDPSYIGLVYCSMVFTILPQIVGIYPTIVIVVVALQRTAGASRDLFDSNINSNPPSTSLKFHANPIGTELSENISTNVTSPVAVDFTQFSNSTPGNAHENDDVKGSVV